VNEDDRRLLKRLGYGRVPPGFEPTTALPRPGTEVLDRLLALHAVVAVAHGLDGSAGRRLVDGYDVGHALAADEAEYLDDAADGVRTEGAARALGVEAVAVLAWALGLGPEPPLDEPVELSPLPADLPGDPSLRPTDELRRMHDLHAVMTWALRADPDLAFGAAPGAVDPYVVRQRHGALRWVLGGDEPASGDHR
jgi:hypothetical protein